MSETDSESTERMLNDEVIRPLENQLCDDTISRKDTLKAMIEQLGIRNEDYLLPAEATLYKVVKNMPSILSQQKIGRWIGHKEHCENLGVMPSGLGDFVWCSNCDCGIDIVEWHRNNYNYCPNCGAKMLEVG